MGIFRVGIFWVGISQGEFTRGNLMGENFPRGNFQGGIFPDTLTISVVKFFYVKNSKKVCKIFHSLILLFQFLENVCALTLVTWLRARLHETRRKVNRFEISLRGVRCQHYSSNGVRLLHYQRSHDLRWSETHFGVNLT